MSAKSNYSPELIAQVFCALLARNEFPHGTHPSEAAHLVEKQLQLLDGVQEAISPKKPYDLENML